MTSRSFPESTFLSIAINSRIRAGATSGGATGSPNRLRSLSTRSASSARISPSRVDNRAAITVPADTASPCSQAP